MLTLTLVAICAMALLVGVVAAASAQDETSTTTTSTTDATASTDTTSSTETTEASSTTSTTETTSTTAAWLMTPVAISLEGVVPTFVSSAEGRIAWTGVPLGGYATMYVYTLSSFLNVQVPSALPGNYYNPSADGPFVVYQGGRAGGYDDIYLYDTGNGLVQQITHNSDPGDGNDWNPRVDAGRIVWEKHALGTAAKTGIYLYDTTGNTEVATLLLAGEEYHDPDISGDYVVCVKDAASGNGSEIILYNLKTKEIKSVAPSIKSNEHPRIDSGHVVWSSGNVPTANSYPWSTYQIKLYDISTGTTTALTKNTAGNFNPSIKGDIVAWEQREPSSIMAYNYYTEESATVIAPGSSASTPDQNNPGQLTKTTVPQEDTLKSPEVDDTGIACYGSTAVYYTELVSEYTPFPDVPAYHPYANAVAYMAMMGVISGYDDGRFGVDDPVTRQQFAKMILLTMCQIDPAVYTASLSDTYPFTDSAAIFRVEGELYAYHYVCKAALTGLTRGYPDGSFRPLDNITRQQVVTMIVRAAGSALETPPPTWQGVLSYLDPVHGQRIWIAEYNGLLDGIVGGPWHTLARWNTGANATRGEVAQMLYNLLRKLQSAM